MEMMYNSLEIDEEQKDQNDTLSKGESDYATIT